MIDRSPLRKLADIYMRFAFNIMAGEARDNPSLRDFRQNFMDRGREFLACVRKALIAAGVCGVCVCRRAPSLLFCD